MILAGDVGGTKIAMGLYRRSVGGESRTVMRERSETFASADYRGLAEVIASFLRHSDIGPGEVEAACFGVAGPVLDNCTRTPNLAWEIDGGEVAREAGLGSVLLINDLLATAEGTLDLEEDQIVTLQEGEPDDDGNAALIAAGTGCGMSVIPRVDGRLYPVATEGGHQDFAPRNDEEFALMRYLGRRYGRVSVERVISGPGLVAIYDHLCEVGEPPEDPELRDRIERTDPGQAISRAAMEEDDPLASKALDMFVSAYGAAAGNLALVGFATAGVYLGGGIAPKILPRLQDGPFLESFRAKGRFRDFVERIPVKVVLNPHAAMIGASIVALRHLEGGG